MSMGSRTLLMNAVRGKFADIMTANVMAQAMDAMAEVLVDYDVEAIRHESPENDFMLGAYLDAVRVQGLSETTIKQYTYDLKIMLKKIDVPTWNITTYHMRKLLAEFKGNIADSTLRNREDCYNAYFKWLHAEGLIKDNPMHNIGKTKVPKKMKEVFSEIDFERLKQNCKNDRDMAIICFLKSTCCRIGEVVGLNRSDIDFANRQCVVNGKGKKQRTVYFNQVAAYNLQKYLESRTDDNEALFLGRRGTRLKDDGIRSMLKTLGASANVFHVHPHKFRRTEATELSKRGMPVEQIQRILGHEKITTTMAYVILDQETVRNAYRKFA